MPPKMLVPSMIRTFSGLRTAGCWRLSSNPAKMADTSVREMEF